MGAFLPRPKRSGYSALFYDEICGSADHEPEKFKQKKAEDRADGPWCCDRYGIHRGHGFSRHWLK